MRKNIFNFFLLAFPALFLLFGLSINSLAEEINYNSMQESTVKISVGNSSFGSGIIINEELDIITNYHVIEDAVLDSSNNLISVCFQTIEAQKPQCLASAGIEKYDAENDLALLSITPFSTDAEVDIRNFTANLAETTLAKEAVTIGNTIHVFGYPGVGGETITYTQGVVSGFTGNYIKIDAKLNSGNSGGGVFNDNGEVVGMATLVTGGVGNIGWIINNDTIEDFISDSWAEGSECGLNAKAINGVCACQAGYEFKNPNNSFSKDCVEETTCSGDHIFFNAQSSTCSCQSGYSLNANGTACEEVSMCDGTNVSFDEDSQSCSCNENYVWEDYYDDDNYNCVIDSCMAENNSYRTEGDEQCSCLEGYEWEFPSNDSNYSCIESSNNTNTLFNQTDPNDSYDSECGMNSFSEGGSCFCEAGYTWIDYEDPDNYDCVFTPTDSSTFSDIDSYYKYNTAISYIHELGIVKGYEDGTYRPENSLSRAEFTKMVLLTAYSTGEVERANNANFSDVSHDDWYNKYVGLAQQEGIINGYSDGSFRPNNPISIAEASKIIGEVYNADLAIYGEWYTPYIDYINSNGTRIEEAPADNLTRGLMAYILYRIGVQQ